MAGFEMLLLALAGVAAVALAGWVWAAAAEADLGAEPDLRLLAAIERAESLPQRPAARLRAPAAGRIDGASAAFT